MRTLLLLSLIVGTPQAGTSTVNDVLLSGYYLGKASVPFMVLPTALDDGDMVLLTDLGLFTVLTVPASGVLYHHWIGNPGKVALWRKINLGTDLMLTGSGAIWGISWMMSPEPNEDAILGRKGAGLFLLMLSGLYGTTCLLDMSPFSSEAIASRKLTVQPYFAFHSRQSGLFLQYQF